MQTMAAGKEEPPWHSTVLSSSEASQETISKESYSLKSGQSLRPPASQLAKLLTKTAIPQLHNMMTNKYLSSVYVTTSTFTIHFQPQKLKKRMKCPTADPAPDSCRRAEAFYCPGLLAKTFLLWWAKTEKSFAHLQQKPKNFFTSLQSPSQINTYHKDKNRLLLNLISCPSTPLSCQLQRAAETLLCSG